MKNSVEIMEKDENSMLKKKYEKPVAVYIGPLPDVLSSSGTYGFDGEEDDLWDLDI